MKKIIITDTDSGFVNNEFNYLIGFQPSLGGIVIGGKKIYILLDSRYSSNFSKIDKNLLLNRIGKKLEVIFIEYKTGLINELIRRIGKSKKIKLEDNINLKYYKEIKKLFKNEIKIEKPFFEKNRITKDEIEKKNIKKAIKIIDKVWLHLVKLNKELKLIGLAEKQVRNIIVKKIMEYGGESESFESIVAFGENSAIPHHRANDTKIKNGPLLVDMGALYNGYCSDFTRCMWVGNKTKNYDEWLEIYNSVKKAHLKAFKNSKIGDKTSDVDKLARKSIEKDGFGEYFTHSTGHGVGLNIHEAPGVSIRSKGKIKKNMIFTIEPGIYIPNKFGVRLENIVFAEEGGIKCVSKINF